MLRIDLRSIRSRIDRPSCSRPLSSRLEGSRLEKVDGRLDVVVGRSFEMADVEGLVLLR